jgi:hypothetical protein
MCADGSRRSVACGGTSDCSTDCHTADTACCRSTSTVAVSDAGGAPLYLLLDEREIWSCPPPPPPPR